MNSSSRFIVALHIMTFLASKVVAFGKEVVGLTSSEDMAMSVNTNPVFIRRLLAQLAKAGLVVTERGRYGGTSLAKSPDQINLLEIYDAVEKGSVFQMHYGDPSDFCPVGSNIQDCMCSVFTDAENAMKQVLGNRTLESVALEIIEMSGVGEMIAQGMSYEEVREVMMAKAGMLQV